MIKNHIVCIAPIQFITKHIRGVMTMQYYKCYSSNLKRFLSTNDIKPISVGFNTHTNRHFSVYILDDELSRLLTAFTKAKREFEAGKSDEA